MNSDVYLILCDGIKELCAPLISELSPGPTNLTFFAANFAGEIGGGIPDYSR